MDGTLICVGTHFNAFSQRFLGLRLLIETSRVLSYDQEMWNFTNATCTFGMKLYLLKFLKRKDWLRYVKGKLDFGFRKEIRFYTFANEVRIYLSPVFVKKITYKLQNVREN